MDTITTQPAESVKPAKLIKVSAGTKHENDIYATEDGSILVRAHTYRTGRRGRREQVTEWTAFLKGRVAVGADETTYDIARGSTVRAVAARLGRYLADRTADTLGPRSRYGFGGDCRPVAK
jgi:hypothetical protein